MLACYLFVLILFLPSSDSQINYACDSRAPCGCSLNPARVSRIFGGERAVNNSWGWTVSILFNQSYFCGGAVISSSWILTTAACVQGQRPSEIIVSAAGDQLLDGKQIRLVSRIVQHPNFDPEWWTNDIAFLQVSTPFNMSDPSIRPICLPDAIAGDYPPVNSSLVTVGWGEMVDNGNLSSNLNQVTLQRIESTSTICVAVINNSTTQLCAMGINGTKGMCLADIGGPLMIFSSTQQWILIGLNSYTYSCSNTGYPSVHTRIIPYLNWIRSMNVTDSMAAGLHNSTITTTRTTTVVSQSTSLTTNPNTSQTPNGCASDHLPLSVYTAMVTILLISKLRE